MCVCVCAVETVQRDYVNISVLTTTVVDDVVYSCRAVNKAGTSRAHTCTVTAIKRSTRTYQHSTTCTCSTASSLPVRRAPPLARSSVLKRRVLHDAGSRLLLRHFYKPEAAPFGTNQQCLSTDRNRNRIPVSLCLDTCVCLPKLPIRVTACSHFSTVASICRRRNKNVGDISLNRTV